MRKINIENLTSRKEVSAMMQELKVSWELIMNIKDPRRRGKEALRFNRLIKQAIHDLKRTYNNDKNARQACQHMQSFLIRNRKIK